MPECRTPFHRRWRTLAAVAAAASLSLLLGACASTVIDDAERFSLAGQYEEALRSLDDALRRRPDDAALRTSHSRQRERVLVHLSTQLELAMAAGRLEEAQRLLDRALKLDPTQARVVSLVEVLKRARQETQANSATGPSGANNAASTSAAANAARAPALTLASPGMGPSFQKPVTLEFREAPLRQVFEGLARSSGVNFVFDKDVRTDVRVTLQLRGVTLDEAMRVILASQQLDRKLLNEQTVLIYPNTAPKQREHQDLVTRVLYLVNADPKLALNLVRTMTKTRDIVVDERLNALVVRDTPEVVRQIEMLLATVDLAEPEVMLAVEVLEVASDRLDELGLNWPTSIGFGIPGAASLVELGANGFRGLVANPAISAALRGKTGTTNLLANPTIRARNREKAKVQIGEKLPVFTSTAATVNVPGSTAVNYLDVGLKLDVEPSVQLDGEVTIKVALEVTNLLREVAGPNASLAYQVGTRLTTTSLRLKDGQTQVLAGLINNQDRQNATGLPGLSEMPLLGRLFGVRRDERSKTEIVMLITPRIVRNLQLPATSAATLPSGTDTQPGAQPLRLAASARVGVSPGRGAALAPGAAAAPASAEVADAPPEGLNIAASAGARVGGTLAVTLANRGSTKATGELLFDANLVQPASAPTAGSAPGRLAFALDPQAETAFIFRVLPAAAGQVVAMQASADTPTRGQVQVQIPAPTATP
jgi:general secretion pathway protein D